MHFVNQTRVTLRSQRIRCVGYTQTRHCVTHESGWLPVVTPAETHLPGLLTNQSNRICSRSALLCITLGRKYTVSWHNLFRLTTLLMSVCPCIVDDMKKEIQPDATQWFIELMIHSTNMFRALLCPSSGAITPPPRHTRYTANALIAYPTHDNTILTTPPFPTDSKFLLYSYVPHAVNIFIVSSSWWWA